MEEKDKIMKEIEELKKMVIIMLKMMKKNN
jgi:hypothetical protein